MLQGDSFENQHFKGLELSGAALGGKEFFRCTFENCHLMESQWKATILEACVFKECDLTRADLAQTGLRGVRFEGCKLMGVDWSRVSSHPELTFVDCNLRYASFTKINLRKVAFTRSTIREANFIDADLTEADFAGADLTGATLRGCTLVRADFRHVSGLFIDPARNKVKDTRVPVETAILLAQNSGMKVE